VAAAGLAEQAEKPQQQQATIQQIQSTDPSEDSQQNPVIAAPTEPAYSGFKLALTGGLDFTNAYVHRGYVQQQGSLVIQPFTTVAADWESPCGLSFTPYFLAFNSIRTDGCQMAAGSMPTRMGTCMGAYQSEYMFGAVTAYKGLTLDVSYNLYGNSCGVFIPTEEMGGKLSYDFGSVWNEPGATIWLGLKPYAALYFETVNVNSSPGTYMEVGVEPAVRFPFFGRKAAISLPYALGMSPSNYYLDAQGNNQFFGYWSFGAAFTVTLPIHCGHWFATASVRYYSLEADSLRITAGKTDEVVGKIGVGFAF
jgi:hypothetical protein